MTYNAIKYNNAQSFMSTTKFLSAIVLLLYCYACGNKPYPHAMQVADTLMYNNPDSALALLEQLNDSITAQTTATQMYYQLLCTKAKDKAYVIHTSDSLILQILHYYEDKEDEKHLPETYYYAGRVYADLGDAPQALDYYQKAAEIQGKGTDYRQLKVVYAQMGELFLFQDVYDEAMKAYKKCYYYNKVYAKDKAGIINSLCDIGNAFTAFGNADSAMHYYQTAYKLAKENGDKKLIDRAQSSLVDLFTQLGQYDMGKAALQSLNAPKPHQQIAYYALAADLFYQMGELDSAAIYYKKLSESEDIYAQQAAYGGLAEIAQKKADSQSALNNIRLYYQCTDSIRKVTDSETIRKMQSLYNYQLREKENTQLKMVNTQQKQWFYYSVFVILLLILYSTAQMQYNKRKKLQLIMKLEKLKKLKEEQYRKSRLFIEENNRKKKELEKALQSSNACSNEMKKQLQEQKKEFILLNNHATMDMKKQSLAESALRQTEIYSKFHKAANDDTIILDSKDWEILRAKIDTCYRNFSSRLRSILIISDIDMKICLLLKIKITITGISTILHRTKSTIVSARKKMYFNAHDENGKPEQWDLFITAL